MSELLSCPFCGSHNLVEGYHSPFVICDDCGAFGPGHADMTHDEATAAWNSRAERTCNLIEDEDLLHCSNCGGAAEKQLWAYWSYCPNCGSSLGDDYDGFAHGAKERKKGLNNDSYN